MNMFTKLFALSAIACMATAVQAQEVTTPPTFDIDPGEVGVIFAADQDTYFEVIKDSKGNSASSWAPVKWGQTCTVSEDEAGDGAAIRIDNLDFLPEQFVSTLDLSEYKYLHLDIWANANGKLDYTMQHWWPSEKFTSPVTDLKAGEWVRLDIDMSSFAWSKKNEIQQRCINVFKLGGEAVDATVNPYPTLIYMTNIIAHNNDTFAAQNTILADGATGIENVTMQKNSKTGHTYNIAGQRVEKNYKGIVFVDGKKMIRK